MSFTSYRLRLCLSNWRETALDLLCLFCRPKLPGASPISGLMFCLMCASILSWAAFEIGSPSDFATLALARWGDVTIRGLATVWHPQTVGNRKLLLDQLPVQRHSVITVRITPAEFRHHRAPERESLDDDEGRAINGNKKPTNELRTTRREAILFLVPGDGNARSARELTSSSLPFAGHSCRLAISGNSTSENSRLVLVPSQIFGHSG